MTVGRPPVLLVAGGLYDGAGAADYWEGSGVAPALRRLGWPVHVTDLAPQPRSWDDETAALAAAVSRLGPPVALVAASHACSAALRLAAGRPDLVRRLVLCWPTTGDDPAVDRRERARLDATGAAAEVVGRLLDGEPVRGLPPDVLRGVALPVVVVPAEPEDERHQRRTAAELRRVLPRATLGLGTPPSRHPAFGPHLPALVSLLDVVLHD